MPHELIDALEGLYTQCISAFDSHEYNKLNELSARSVLDEAFGAAISSGCDRTQAVVEAASRLTLSAPDSTRFQLIQGEISALGIVAAIRLRQFNSVVTHLVTLLESCAALAEKDGAATACIVAACEIAQDSTMIARLCTHLAAHYSGLRDHERRIYWAKKGLAVATGAQARALQRLLDE